MGLVKQEGLFAMDSDYRNPKLPDDKGDQSAADSPKYRTLVRKLALKAGLTEDELLARDRARAENPPYPLSECLVPDEALELLESFDCRFDTEGCLHLVERTDAKRSADIARHKEHVLSCAFCGPMLASMQPPETMRKAFFDAISNASKTQDVKTEEPRAEPARRPSRRSAGQYRVVGGIALIFLLGISLASKLIPRTFTLALAEMSRQYLPEIVAFIFLGTWAISRSLKRLPAYFGSANGKPSNGMNWSLLATYRGYESGALVLVLAAGTLVSGARGIREDVYQSKQQLKQITADALEKYDANASAPGLDLNGSDLRILSASNSQDRIEYVLKRGNVPGKFIAHIKNGTATVEWEVLEQRAPQFALQLGTLERTGLHGKETFVLPSGVILPVANNSTNHQLSSGRVLAAEIVGYGDSVQAMVVPTLATDR